MWAVLLGIFGVIFVLIGVFLFIYSNPLRTKWYITAFTSVGLFLAFSILGIIPVDITSRTCDINQKPGCQESWIYVDNDVLQIMWTVIYWLSFVVMWTVIPYFMSYPFAGDFTVLERCRTAIRRNVIFYLIVGAVGVVFLAIYLIFTRDSNWYGVCIAASNAYGLLMMIFLLGNGVVDVPYKLIKRVTLTKLLKCTLLDVYHYNKKFEEAKSELLGYVSQVKAYNNRISESDPLRKYVNVLVSKVSDFLSSVEAEGDAEKKVEKMVSINEGIIDVMWRYKQFLFLKEKSSDKAKLYNAISQNDSKIKLYKVIYYKFIRTFFVAVFFVLSGIVGLLVLWSEFAITINYIQLLANNNDPTKVVDVSPYAYFIEALSTTPTLVYVSSYLPLILCVLYSFESLLTLQFISFLRILPNRLTDPYSLLFAGAYLCRISSPLALNTIQLISFGTGNYQHESVGDSCDLTAFQCVMKSMEAVPFFGTDFISIFPSVSVIVALFSVIFIFFDPWKLYDAIISKFTKKKTEKALPESEMIKVALEIIGEQNTEMTDEPTNITKRAKNTKSYGKIEENVSVDGDDVDFTKLSSPSTNKTYDFSDLDN
ncbi:hypothetical protein EIN_226440 [Entamoeba invadens IP1]|uniref:LMBR1 domain containing protein n=1 Tax=Entamoeba invadens IP1 TaxID=370355 RepID=A0A0A1U2G5_ENTIV|nr:hypothetical protein EIN_226440 [Entamoeba invadens IP1]ELP88271.1 hypothetical protein EIN_226440 [Entamoeba invadens IP1]|eukprot:XP_004255042.1 hypothetical protein EIN_226440 [Entamoeba invadens IP1]